MNKLKLKEEKEKKEKKRKQNPTIRRGEGEEEGINK